MKPFWVKKRGQNPEIYLKNQKLDKTKNTSKLLILKNCIKIQKLIIIQ